MSRWIDPISLLPLTGLLAFMLVVLPGRSHAGDDITCHPALHSDQPNFVIGYGSLMNRASKEDTWKSAGRGAPVKLHGFKRSWSARGTDIGYSTTFLGVRSGGEDEMVAALYRVYDTGDFNAGDAREYIYCRALVDPTQITMLDGSGVPTQGKTWIYLVKSDSDHAPEPRFPIVQSYVDIFLSGCMELASLVIDKDFDFLAACITTTKGWSVHWVNDRVYPRRPFSIPNARRIDALLKQMLPKQFEAIRIE